MRYKLSKTAKLQERFPLLGPTEQQFENSLSKLKMSQERHFGGDAMGCMVGNIIHKAYKSIRSGDYTLTECFKNQPETRNKMNALWANLSNVDYYLSLRNPTPEEVESFAQECEISPGKWLN